MKKKILSLFLAFVLLVSLTACGGDTPPTNANTGDNSDGNIDWPQKPVTIIVGFGAGGSADLTARNLGRGMSEYLGVPVNVLNVAGGSASIAGQQVYEADADGYTFLAGAINVAAPWRISDYADIGWEDFYGFIGATTTYALFVADNSDYETFEDLYEDARANPGALKWGHNGYGSLNQVSGDLMAQIAGIETVGVPYSSGAEAATKVVAGEADYTWLGLSDAADFIASGDLRAVGIINLDGPQTLNNVRGEYEVPSLIEAYPDMEMLDSVVGWGLFLRRDTEDAVVAKVWDAFNYAVEQPAYLEFCESINVSPAELAGPESDEKVAFMESFITWGLYDLDMAIEGKSPEDYDSPRPEDYTWPPNERASSAKPWPAK